VPEDLTSKYALVILSVALTGVAVFSSYRLLLAGKFNASRIIFLATTYLCITYFVFITGGFYHSVVMPVYIVPVVATFCIYGGRWSIIATILTPLILILLALTGEVLNITYPDYSHEGFAVPSSFLVWMGAYGMIVVGLIHAERSNGMFMRSAQKLIKEKQELAATDFLTGLRNRRDFILSAAKLRESYTSSDIYILMASIDVDRFKQINDSYGHLSGDNVLQAIGKSLKKIENEDTLVARLGGDEFGLFAILQDEESAIDLVNKLEEALPRKVMGADSQIDVSCSIGASYQHLHIYDVKYMITSIDYALYQAKAKLGSWAHIFSKENAEEIQKNNETLFLVKDRFEKNEFLNHYQLMMPSSHQPAIVEALLRVHDNNRRIINPGICMEAINRLNLTAEFTERQIKSAILDVMAVSSNLWLACNLSPFQLRSAQIVSIIQKVLEETGFDSERLILEISELTSYCDNTILNLKKLKKLNVKLAIDDFGVGLTCFQIFNEIDIDIVKADRSLLSSGPENNLNRFILKQVAEYCQKFDVESVCEGVETDAMIAEMRNFGFDYFQGYGISRPSNLIEQMKVLPVQPTRKLYRAAS